MSLSINTNHAAVRASANLAMNNELLMKSMQRLSSGRRIIDTSDDAGGLAIAMKLNSSIEKLKGVSSNIKNSISFLDVQDGIIQGAAAGGTASAGHGGGVRTALIPGPRLCPHARARAAPRSRSSSRFAACWFGVGRAVRRI